MLCNQPASSTPCLQPFLQDGFAVGGALTVADIALFDLTAFYIQKYGGEFEAAYPALAAHHAKIAALPRIAAYLAGPLRPAK